jgi:hypothetical protein
MMSILTHPEWNQETGGLAVAEAFGEQVERKSSIYTHILDTQTS